MLSHQKNVGVRILIATPEKYLFHSLYTEITDALWGVCYFFEIEIRSRSGSEWTSGGRPEPRMTEPRSRGESRIPIPLPEKPTCFDKSVFQLNPPLRVGEIRLDGGWVDLISSEAKPKISSALADFILASARISLNML